MRVRGISRAHDAHRTSARRGSRPSRSRKHDGPPETSGKMAGEEGFEPSNAGIKIRCLNQLGDSPAETCASSVPRPPRTSPRVTRSMRADASPSRLPAGGCVRNLRKRHPFSPTATGVSIAATRRTRTRAARITRAPGGRPRLDARSPHCQRSTTTRTSTGSPPRRFRMTREGFCCPSSE